MAVLRMLENRIITAQEAERLLTALQKIDKRANREAIDTSIREMLDRAGEALSIFVHSVGEKAEDAAKEMEPIIKKVAWTVAEKAEDVKAYAEKVKKELLDEKEKRELPICGKETEEEREIKRAEITGGCGRQNREDEHV